MERITGLEEQLRSEQRARQEARDRVRELEAELRASTLEGRAQVTALTAEVRAKDRRVSLLEDELGALHVPRAADRRLLGRGAPGGVPSTIEESREESAGPARPQGGSSGERRAGLALGDFLSGAVTGRGEARRQGLSKRGAKGAQVR